MAYLINKTNGQLLVSILDNQADGPNVNPGFNASDLNLFGKNYAIYGELLNENFVKLLENFANNTPPTTAIRGELWYDTSNPTRNILKVYNGNNFVPVSPVTSSANAPSSVIIGDIWWDSTDLQLKVWDGVDWKVIGPLFKQSDGVSGAIPEAVYDIAGNKHIVTKFYTNNQYNAIYSYDTEFIANVELPGFGNVVSPGFTLGTNTSDSLYRGTATNSQLLGGILPAQYARKDRAEVFAANVGVANNNFTIGNTTSGNVILRNTINSGSLELHVVSDGINVRSAYISGTTGRIKTDLSPAQNNDLTNKLYVDAFVNNAIAPLETTATVNTKINEVYEYANTRITNAVAPLASTVYVNNLVATAVAPLALQTDLISNVAALYNYANVTVATAVAPLATQSNVNAVESSLTNYIDAKFVTGMIMQWFGAANNVPAGWAICDGTNSTPDMRDLFVVGAGREYAPLDRGGSNSVALTQDELPEHSHTAASSSSSVEHSHSVTVNTVSQAHSHTVTTGVESQGHSHVVTTDAVNINHSHSGTTLGESNPHNHLGSAEAVGNHQHVYPGDDQLDNANGVAGWVTSFDGTFPYDAKSQYNGGGKLWRTSPSGAHNHVVSIGSNNTGHSHFFNTGPMSGNNSHSHTGSTGDRNQSHTHTGSSNTVTESHTHTGSTNTNIGTHNHNVEVESTGSGRSFDITPPYIALYYIMKL
jgi:hypothetical protein